MKRKEITHSGSTVPKVLGDAINEWGYEVQMLKCVEAFGELTDAIVRLMIFDKVPDTMLRDIDGTTRQRLVDNVVNELADTEIMACQLVNILGISATNVYNAQDAKLARLNTRIQMSLRRHAQGDAEHEKIHKTDYNPVN